METHFPYLTSTSRPPSHHVVTSTYRAAFDALVKEGKLQPLVLSYHLYGCRLLLLYFCIPHTQSPLIYAARWPVLAVILAFKWKTLWEATSISMATGLRIGILMPCVTKHLLRGVLSTTPGNRLAEYTVKMSLKQDARTGSDVLLGLSPDANDGLVGETGTPTLTNENRSLN